jgi:nucleoside-diphosphate-sugar epimerase
MQVLITGGCGFIGSHLALALARAGHRVRAVDNFDAYYSPALKRKNAALLAKNGVLVHRLDLAVDPIASVVEHADCVIHAAAQPGIDENSPYESYIKNNFTATVALIDAIARAGSHPRLIHFSTSSVYGRIATGNEESLLFPVSAYGVTKVAAEAAVTSAVRRGEMSACILRPFSVYGERERPDKLFPKLFYALKHNSELTVFEGSPLHQRSFTYVRDVVDCALAAMNRWDAAAGEIFNIGTTTVSTTGQSLELAQEITGKKLKIKKLPARAGDQDVTIADMSKTQKLLGVNPQTTLRDGMMKVWAWAQGEL